MFSAGIERAVRVAFEAHAGQLRKGLDRAPYVVHPVHVAVMLARLGASDEAIQAGLLHDVVEDSADWTIARVEQEFGARVASIVGELTEDKSRTWQARKQQAIDDVARLSREAALIKACDKLHNLRTLLDQLDSSEGAEAAVWRQFKGGREQTLAMSRGLIEALVERGLPGGLDQALRATLAQLAARPA